ncbi:MAG: hypothetical protein ACMXYG_03290 [Candidatus Woesearchaeota archaeon]
MKQDTKVALIEHPNYKIGYDKGHNAETPPAGINQIMPEPREVEIDLDDTASTMESLSELFPRKKKLFDYDDSKLAKLGLHANAYIPDLAEILKHEMRNPCLSEIKPRTVLKLFPYLNPEQTIDDIVSKAALREGYIDGIKQYAEEAKLHVVFGDVAGVNLKNKYHLASFAKGMAMQCPSVWMPGLEEFGGRPVSADADAYKAGILIALAKKGVDLVIGDGPFNQETYDAFQSGRYAKPVKTEKGETAVSIADVAEMKSDFEMHYCLGLDLWIVEQGLKGKVTHQDIRHPEALYAFKSLMEGKKIGDYDDTEPSVERITRNVGQVAYDLATRIVGEMK